MSTGGIAGHSTYALMLDLPTTDYSTPEAERPVPVHSVYTIYGSPAVTAGDKAGEPAHTMDFPPAHQEPAPFGANIGGELSALNTLSNSARPETPADQPTRPAIMCHRSCAIAAIAATRLTLECWCAEQGRVQRIGATRPARSGTRGSRWAAQTGTTTGTTTTSPPSVCPENTAFPCVCSLPSSFHNKQKTVLKQGSTSRAGQRPRASLSKTARCSGPNQRRRRRSGRASWRRSRSRAVRRGRRPSTRVGRSAPVKDPRCRTSLQLFSRFNSCRLIGYRGYFQAAATGRPPTSCSATPRCQLGRAAERARTSRVIGGGACKGVVATGRQGLCRPALAATHSSSPAAPSCTLRASPDPQAAGNGTAFRLRFHCLSDLRHCLPLQHCSGSGPMQGQTSTPTSATNQATVTCNSGGGDTGEVIRVSCMAGQRLPGAIWKDEPVLPIWESTTPLCAADPDGPPSRTVSVRAPSPPRLSSSEPSPMDSYASTSGSSSGSSHPGFSPRSSRGPALLCTLLCTCVYTLYFALYFALYLCVHAKQLQKRQVHFQSLD